MDATGHFIVDLTVGLVAAAAGGYLARLARLTPVLGYLVAGVAIGPFTPGITADAGSLNGLGELGLILLVFSLGLGFAPSELRRVGVAPLVANVAVMGAIGVASYFIAHLFGVRDAFTAALVVPLSSTAVGVALLDTFGLRARFAGQLTVALLVAQDLFAVALLVLASTPADKLTPMGLLWPLVSGIVFVAVAIVLGATVLQRAVKSVVNRAPSELLIPTFTALALVAGWLGHKAGLSYEFGAFVAGAVISEAAGSRTAQAVVGPFRELFVMLFFVALGMALDVHAVMAAWPTILALGAILVAVRLGVWSFAMRLLKFGWGTAVAVAIALLPLGEFNMVLANAAQASGRINGSEFAGLIGATFLSILVASVGAPAWRRPMAALERAAAVPERAVDHEGSEADVVLIGYGRTGRSIASMLREAHLSIAVIERDEALLARAEADGLVAIVGDGTDPLTVDAMISAKTVLVISTVPDSAANAVLAQRMKHRSMRSLVRAERQEDVAALLAAGAVEAIVPESEGALGLGETALRELGVDGAVISGYVVRERSRLREGAR
jgi:CPA2 family monovalent cation:H+ antiporter-2